MVSYSRPETASIRTTEIDAWVDLYHSQIVNKRISPTLWARLIDGDPSDVIRVYSMQDTAAWDLAQTCGYLGVKPGWHEAQGHDEHGFLKHSYLPQYEYIRTVMAERMPDFSGDFPVWAWPFRPNLRQWSYLREPTVLVVADVARSRMLMSDYDLWHMPLNNGAVCWTEEEDDAFDVAYPRNQYQGVMTPEVRATWDRVFDLRKRTDPKILAWCGQCDRIQICVDRIYLNEIVSVCPVQGRRGRTGGRRW